jgi:hypothetical protein
MRGTGISLLLVVLSLALVGCQSDKQSRVYDTDMDVTWEAAVRVARDLTAVESEVADKEARRIVMEWTAVTRGETQSRTGAVSGAEVGRAVVELEPAESGTRVSVETDMESHEAELWPRLSGDPDTIPFATRAPSGGFPQIFLDRLSVELDEGDAAGQ